MPSLNEFNYPSAGRLIEDIMNQAIAIAKRENFFIEVSDSTSQFYSLLDDLIAESVFHLIKIDVFKFKIVPKNEFIARLKIHLFADFALNSNQDLSALELIHSLLLDCIDWEDQNYHVCKKQQGVQIEHVL